MCSEMKSKLVLHTIQRLTKERLYLLLISAILFTPYLLWTIGYLRTNLSKDVQDYYPQQYIFFIEAVKFDKMLHVLNAGRFKMKNCLDRFFHKGNILLWFPDDLADLTRSLMNTIKDKVLMLNTIFWIDLNCRLLYNKIH